MANILTNKDKILVSFELSDISHTFLRDQCIVTVVLSDDFIGNVDTVSGRWGGFINERLLKLQNHSSIQQVPVEYIEQIIILDLTTNFVTKISLL